jgi:hypothetical protein
VLKQVRLIIISFSWQFVSGCRYGRRFIAQPFSVVLHGRYLRSAQIIIAALARFFRSLIIPPPQERCLAQLTVFSPLGKSYFADQHRSHPPDLLRNLGRIFRTIGNFGSSSNRFRDQSRALPAESITAIGRKPSSFVSKIHSGSLNGSFTLEAIIGSTNCGKGILTWRHDTLDA